MKDIFQSESSKIVLGILWGFGFYADKLKQVTEKWELCMENYGKL